MSDPRVYYYFYLMGREEPVELRSFDTRDLVKRVLGSQAIRSVALDASRAAFAGIVFDHLKSEWIAQNVDEIQEAGGDSDKAFRLYVDGRIDETASDLEAAMLSEMIEILDALDLAEDDDEDDYQDDDDEDDVNEDSDFEDEDEPNEDDDGEPPDIPDTRSITKPLSLQARYAQWEVRGREDAKADVEGDLIKIRLDASTTVGTMAKESTARALVDSYLERHTTRIRRSWRGAHLATLGDLRPAKAYGRWLTGWTEYAMEVVLDELNKKAA